MWWGYHDLGSAVSLNAVECVILLLSDGFVYVLITRGSLPKSISYDIVVPI